MTTTQLLASLPPAQREMVRPTIEALSPKMREVTEALRPLMATMQAVMSEGTATENAA